jgi:hypothetical protein
MTDRNFNDERFEKRLSEITRRCWGDPASFYVELAKLFIGMADTPARRKSAQAALKHSRLFAASTPTMTIGKSLTACCSTT